MSIKDHKDEVIRWIKSPNNVRVWEKPKKGEANWGVSIDPKWDNDYYYIVEDEWSELRKAQIDGKTIQYNSFGKWEDANFQLSFIDDISHYRIKFEDSNEWDTPEDEDMITYHAKRLNPDRETKWVNGRKNFCIVYLPDDNKYEIRESTTSYVLAAVYMDYREAIKIVLALNCGDLKYDI